MMRVEGGGRWSSRIAFARALHAFSTAAARSSIACLVLSFDLISKDEPFFWGAVTATARVTILPASGAGSEESFPTENIVGCGGVYLL